MSVTDRCNLRCSYCMPEEEYPWLPKQRILSYEEMTRLVRCFQGAGVNRVRLTGGEPLLRRDVERLVEQLAGLGLDEVTLTTNGIGLPERAEDLVRAGLARVTVSLDTLDPRRFKEMTRRDSLPATLEGLAAARSAGLPAKLNMVVMRGVNDDEVGAMLAFGIENDIEVRFIEYMDVGGATQWDSSQVVSADEILERLADFGPLTEEAGRGSAPASRFHTASGARFGIIASTTRPFCSACDRARITADGHLFTCLYGREGLDLRTPLRAGESDEDLTARIAGAWGRRRDRGAEERLGVLDRGALAARNELLEDPRLEMHTRGG